MLTLFEDAIGIGTGTGEHFAIIAIRIGCALMLAIVLAYRPWRRLMGLPATKPKITQAQVLLAVAGALIMAIVGDSMARAFGLVGLGGVVRFKAGIKDPRDAVVMFMMIGIGMACGSGLVGLAVMATVIAAGALICFDRFGVSSPSRTRVMFIADDPTATLAMLRQLWPAARVMVAPVTLGVPGKIVIELELAENEDAATLHGRASAAGITGIREVGISDD